MHHTKNKISVSVILACAGMLSACGGGSDPAPQDQITTIPEAPTLDIQPKTLSLTSDNFGLVAYMLLTSTKASAELATATAGVSLLTTAFALMNIDAGGNPTTPCRVAGTSTFDFADNDGDTNISAGDAATITNAGCQPVSSVTMNGKKVMEILQFVNPPTATDLNITELKLTHFNETTNDSLGESRLDGSMKVTLESQEFVNGSSVILARVEVAELVSVAEGVTTTLSDWKASTTTTEFQDVPTVKFEASGAVEDSIFGSYTFDMPVPFVTFDPPLMSLGEPHTGKFRVVMADKRSVVFTVEDDVSVRVEADLDSDGVNELSRSYSWDELGTQYFTWLTN